MMVLPMLACQMRTTATPSNSATSASVVAASKISSDHDELYVKLNGEMVYLWRAVDHEGEIARRDDRWRLGVPDTHGAAVAGNDSQSFTDRP